MPPVPSSPCPDGSESYSDGRGRRCAPQRQRPRVARFHVRPHPGSGEDGATEPHRTHRPWRNRTARKDPCDPPDGSGFPPASRSTPRPPSRRGQVGRGRRRRTARAPGRPASPCTRGGGGIPRRRRTSVWPTPSGASGASSGHAKTSGAPRGRASARGFRSTRFSSPPAVKTSTPSSWPPTVEGAWPTPCGDARRRESCARPPVPCLPSGIRPYAPERDAARRAAAVPPGPFRERPAKRTKTAHGFVRALSRLTRPGTRR